jgi:hypothetical protein
LLIFVCTGEISVAKTPEKPPLSLVGPGSTGTPPASIGIAPPRPLGTHGQALWDRVQREFWIVDAGGVELLAQACAAVDRAEALAELIAREGEIVHGRAGPRVHPAFRFELSARALACRLLERLGITMEPVRPVGRPLGR